jgi:acyl carrier protein
MSLDNDVRRILRETLVLGDEIESLDASSPLLGAIPELDSVGVISVLTALEEEYDIVVEDDEISAAVFNTLGTLTGFLEEKVG